MSITPHPPPGPFPQMIFEDVGGLPVARLPRDEKTDVVRVPNGSRLFSLEQAVGRFNTTEAVLRQLYAVAFGDPIAAAEREGTVAGVQGASGGVAGDAPVQQQIPASSQVDLLKIVKYPHLTPEQWDYFLELCRRQQLDPWRRHAWPEVRTDERTAERRLVVLVTIDTLRAKAAATGAYNGQTAPAWCDDDGNWTDVWSGKNDTAQAGPPLAARVGIYRKGVEHPFWGVAQWEFYVQWYTPRGTHERVMDPFWARGAGAHMLAKCFDPDTEILTTNGFERFAGVTGRVLQVTDRGLEPTDARPFVQEYAGDMVTLDSDDLNFSVTPNHDMITTGGKMEAGRLYEEARARAKFWIPRSVSGSRADVPISDEAIMLAAAYLADGHDVGATSPGIFKISVSKPRKIAALRQIGLFHLQAIRHCAGSVAHTPARSIVTRSDKTQFVYRFEQMGGLVGRRKQVDLAMLLSLSRRQARMFVDALVDFDGNEARETGVRRFYASNLEILQAFEVAAVAAGYSVSDRKERQADIGGVNYFVTVSDRNEIPVFRWGRAYHHTPKGETRHHTGLELTPNAAGKVWCVTVPTGVIVVRRHGFSMLCGNCAEALALRKAFPDELAELYTAEEVRRAADTSEQDARDAAGRHTAFPSSPFYKPPKAPPAPDEIVAANNIAPLDVDDDTPSTRMQMELRLVDEFGLTSPRIRAAVLDRARELHRLQDTYPQLFYAQVLRELRSNPGLYGLPPRPMHAA